MNMSVLRFALGLSLFATALLLLPGSARPASSAVQASDAPAGGLLQLRFHGELGTGGHLVEVELDLGPAYDLFALHVHLAPGTTGAELARLVHGRLTRVGAPAQLAETPGGGEATVWVDGARGVALRLGSGLGAWVATAEGAPSLIRVVDHSAIPGDAAVRIAASSALPRQGQPPLRRSSSARVELPDGTSAAAAARLMWEAVDQTWMTERPGGDHWRPIKLLDGSLFTGLSIGIEGDTDRRLELTL